MKIVSFFFCNRIPIAFFHYQFATFLAILHIKTSWLENSITLSMRAIKIAFFRKYLATLYIEILAMAAISIVLNMRAIKNAALRSWTFDIIEPNRAIDGNIQFGVGASGDFATSCFAEHSADDSWSVVVGVDVVVTNRAPLSVHPHFYSAHVARQSVVVVETDQFIRYVCVWKMKSVKTC